MTLQHSPGCLTIAGAIPATAAHAHHALQLSIGLDAPILVDGLEYANILIDADTQHELSAASCLTLLIDAESHCARQLREHYLDKSSTATNLAVRAHSATPWTDVARQLVPNACTGRHLDTRIEETLRWFDTMQSKGEWLEVTLQQACKRAALSQSRFLHLFREQTGIAWRPALVWRRALVAMHYARNAPLTTAAQMAGYSDSAHLSRQFKSIFGLSPSVVLKNSQFIQSP